MKSLRSTAKVLDPRSFRLAVLDPLPTTAVLDCDGTLWSADAGHGFMLWSFAHGLVSKAVNARIERRYENYLRGEVSEVAMCADMVTMYEGLPESRLREAAANFVREHIAPTIFPEMLSLVSELRAAGVPLWAVSSTNVWVIEYALGAFGIPAGRILGARVCVNAGIMTGELLEVPSGPAKATALVAAGIAAPDCVFGNSVHDAAMLAMAARPFCVNPSPALRQIAEESGWFMFQPSR